MTQTTQIPVFKGELLTHTAEMIKAAGYDVYYAIWRNDTRSTTYFYFTDGTKIGYAQEGYFGGIRFSTVHRPCRECGTGYGLTVDPGLFEPTIEDAKRAFIFAPQWASPRDVAAIKKWENWAAFQADRTNTCEFKKY